VTGEEREVSPVDLAGAIGRAVRAGLRLRSSDRDEMWIEVSCPVCAAILTTAGQPWDPVPAVRRLEAFMSRHHHGGQPGTGEDQW
jgi:hypothetical protein